MIFRWVEMRSRWIAAREGGPFGADGRPWQQARRVMGFWREAEGWDWAGRIEYLPRA